jgi:protein-export membrane protein SecD
MMYFSRARTALILGICALGVLLCLPNLFAPPASWLPWHRVNLGLDLRGGSYLLMQVDMDTVVRERLESLADEARQALIHAPGGTIGYRNIAVSTGTAAATPIAAPAATSPDASVPGTSAPATSAAGTTAAGTTAAGTPAAGTPAPAAAPPASATAPGGTSPAGAGGYGATPAMALAPAAMPSGISRVTLRLPDPAKLDAALAALRAIPQSTPGEFAVAGTPDGLVTLTLQPAALRARARAAVEQSIEIVRRRIDGSGVADPQITRQGEDRIVVELPGVTDPNRIRDLLGQTAKMSFHLVDEKANPAAPPPGEDSLPMTEGPNNGPSGTRIVVNRHADVDGASLTNATPSQSSQNGQWVVNFTLDSAGGRRFADITRTNLGHRFAIVLDNKVISAPVIQGVIPGGSGQISGSFNPQTATDLALLLRAGALPAPLTVMESRSVGPELGADSIRAGALSLLVGLLLVVGFMGTFYGLFGWLANVALVANLVLMVAILSLFGATLTLPGMAGILLTLGMAVDANILINERIREEARAGRTPANAMEAGFRRAYSTIIDSNVTALLAHVMLFVFGTGPVRGFALTITVGIVTTLFTATVLARLLMVKWWARRRPALLPV